MVEADVLPALADWFRAAAVTGAQIAFNTTGPQRRRSFSVTGGALLAEPRAKKLCDDLRVGNDWCDFNIV
eukprot:3750101-Pyramimonas_sp.AAC.1